MMKLNKIGSVLGKKNYVNAMTDVTGFGLLGHLVEMAEGSNLSALLEYKNVKHITPNLLNYLNKGSIPGGTIRNWDSYGHKILLPANNSDIIKNIISDPQTSGGLLVAVDYNSVDEMKDLLKEHHLNEFILPVGRMITKEKFTIRVEE